MFISLGPRVLQRLSEQGALKTLNPSLQKKEISASFPCLILIEIKGFEVFQIRGKKELICKQTWLGITW